MRIAIWILIFLSAVVFHEVSHGLVAYAFGDPTAKNAGRLTLNPLKHIDFFWTLFLPALLFFTTRGQFMIGMAKPVPVDFSRLHKPRFDMIFVAIAGPIANILLAFLINIAWQFSAPPDISSASHAALFLLYAIYLNLGLAVFNMIPIPPLDGSRVLAGILPRSLAYPYLKVEPFGFAIILALYFTGFLYYWIVPGINFFCRILHIPAIGINF